MSCSLEACQSRSSYLAAEEGNATSLLVIKSDCNAYPASVCKAVDDTGNLKLQIASIDVSQSPRKSYIVSMATSRCLTATDITKICA